MSPSATPATWNEGGCHQVPRLPRKSDAASIATKGPQACHQTQPSPISTTPATQNEGGCHQKPRLPRETKVDVTKCHACHAKVKGPQARHQTQPSPISTTPATQNEGGCHQKPRLPRPQARHQTQPSPIGTTPATQNQGGCHRETKVDVTKCHACHAKVTRRQSRPRDPKRVTRPTQKIRLDNFLPNS